MNTENIMAGVRRFLAKEFPDRAAEVDGLDKAAPLFDLGLVDSLSFLGLVTWLEAEYRIAIPPSDYQPDRFRTLEMVAEYVERARGTS